MIPKLLPFAAMLVAAAVPASGHAAAPARASADPSTWIKTSQFDRPAYYRQGLASNSLTGDVFFSGSFAGLYRTRGGNQQLASNTSPIPKAVADGEQYNHIGDIAFDGAEGGRLLLPLESYQPFQPDPNPSKTGSVGVMDAKTLAWKYYVKLDPAEIPKAMWFAVDAQQGLLWTLAGTDLLAYNLADVNPANAAPGAAPIHSVKRLVNAAPNSAGGGAVLGNRIYLSTQAGGVDQVVSVDLTTGASRTEIEVPGTMEPEGLDFGPYLGGLLHWELVPGGGLSNTQLLNYLPKGSRLALKLDHARFRAGRSVKLHATVTVRTNGVSIPLQGVEVRLGGKHRKTDARGRATIAVELTRGGYRALAFYPGLRAARKTVRAI